MVRQWATVVLWRPTVSPRQPRTIEVHQGKGQSKVPCHCLPGGHANYDVVRKCLVIIHFGINEKRETLDYAVVMVVINKRV